MNKKKSKALAFLLAASLLVPSVNGIVSAAELDNVKSTDKVVAYQEATNPDGSDTSTQDPLTQNVAKIGNEEYATLTDAINDAAEGATITLLGNVTEDITVNKNITIDGKKTYKIIGNTKLENGTLKNTTLKPKDDDKTGSVLQIGSTAENTINMYGVTVEYSVVNRSGGSNVIAGNNSNITIENCLFTNNPNNGENTIDVSNWSFGLSMGTQGSKGSFTFRNNEFRGAFRTMLPSINGKVTIDNNTFINTVQSVVPGTTDGAKKEATCITTGYTENDSFTITNNTFDNAGAFLFQKTSNVTKNTFKGEKFIHYIQLKGYAGGNLDLTDNIFEMGNNAVCSMDTIDAEILLPVGELAYNYWAWDSLEELTDPTKANLDNYKYSFENDKNRVYYPTSEKALKAFVNPKPNIPIIGVNNNEKVVISENITIDKETALNIPKDKNITIEVPKGKTLTLSSADAIDVTGSLTISGDGEVVIAKSGEVSVKENASLSIETKVDNNGSINNSGKLSNSGTLTNTGTISNSGTMSNSSKIDNKGTMSNSGTVANLKDGSVEGNPITKVDNGETIAPNDVKDIKFKDASKSLNSITVSIEDLGGFNKLGEVEFTIVEGSVTESRGGIWVRAKDGKVTFDGLNPNTKYTVFARYKGLGNTEVKMEVSTLSPSTGGGGVVAPTYTHKEIIGSDRYDTAAKIADKLVLYDNVVLVNAESSMSDGLSASGLAGKENGAILLTKKDSIPKVTMDRIKKVKKVYIIGGEAAISAKVANELTAAGIKVERLGGKDRVETSEIVAKKLGNYSDAFVVNGFKGEADAMSASAIAAKKGAPILLTNGKTSTHAKKSGVEYYVIGGNSVVDKSIADKYNAEVLAGKDRYATNKEVINEFYSGSDKVYIANGDKLVDALTASPLAKKDGIVLVNEKSDKSILKGKNTVQVGGMDFKIEFEK